MIKIVLICGKWGGGIGDVDNYVVLKICLMRLFFYSVIVFDLLVY